MNVRRRRPRLWTLGVLLTLLLASASSARELTPGVALAQEAAGQAPLPANVAAAFDAIAQRASQLRGLAPRRDVPRVVLTPDEFRARVVDDLSDPETQTSIEHSRQLMVALGLLGPDVDLYALELAFRAGIVLGQYDPDTKQLYVITGTDPTSAMARVTFAHEYTHALQDQYYDIRALMPKNSDNSDRDLGVSSLLEGDALLMEEIYQRQAMSPADRQEKQREENALAAGVDLSQVPLVLREETYFPYEQGPRFIGAVLGQDAIREALDQGAGYGPRVNRIFEDPPRSTAQIIHPEKYLAGENPVAVHFPDLAAALGDGWQQLEADVLGEVDHRILIQQFSDRQRGEQAAAGWAGDGYVLLSNGDHVAVVVSSRWETPDAASTWYGAYAQTVAARYGSRAEAVEQRPDRTVWRTPDGMELLSRDGTATTILIAKTPEEIATLEQALAGVPATAGHVLVPTVPLP